MSRPPWSPPRPAVRESRTELERLLEALSPRLMAPRLASALGLPPGRCHVVDAKYEPGICATVAYSFTGRMVRGDLICGDEGTVDRSPVQTRVVDPGLRLSLFPDDPDLPLLPLIMEPGRIGPVAARTPHFRARGLNANRARMSRIRVLRYRPGKRATLAIALGTATPFVVAKAYHEARKASAVATESVALAGLPTGASGLRFAAPVAELPELGVVVQAWVDGTPLDALIGHARPSPTLGRAAVEIAAEVLAAFHGLPPRTDRERPVNRELVRFGTRADRVRTVDPQLGDAAGYLARRLIEVGAALPPPVLGPVHGDCKPSQFLVQGGGAYLLDLDHYGIADQAVDVGTFVASLRQLGIRHRLARRPAGRPGLLTGLGDHFLDRYLALTGRHGQLARIRWHEAVALERKALRAFMRAPLSPLAAAMVNEADRCLDSMRGLG